MAPRRKAPSPILGAVREMIADASDTLVTENSRFKHTFEVAIDKISPLPHRAFGSVRLQDAGPLQLLAAG